MSLPLASGLRCAFTKLAAFSLFLRRFLYNDAAYLAKELADFAVWWKAREDLSPRAQNMLRLDNEIKSLQSFANRSYSNEMNIQKTILRDLLGGEQTSVAQICLSPKVSFLNCRE